MERADGVLEPLNDFVLLELEEVPDYAKHKGYEKIVVPDQYAHGPEDRPVWGKVISTGQQCHGWVRKGDRVVIGKWEGSRQEYQGRKYIFVRESAILGFDLAVA